MSPPRRFINLGSQELCVQTLPYSKRIGQEREIPDPSFVGELVERLLHRVRRGATDEPGFIKEKHFNGGSTHALIVACDAIGVDEAGNQ